MHHSLKDKNQFKEVYITYFSRMKHFAQQYVIRVEDAENITQDIFIELWEKKKEFSSSDLLKGYLFLVLKNKCIDFLRHKTLEQVVKNDMFETYQRELQLNFEALDSLDNNFLTHTDLEKIILDAVEILPERCKQIFIKNKFEGKKQKTIAEELSISINTVESQMSIAYKKLRETLKDQVSFFFTLFI